MSNRIIDLLFVNRCALCRKPSDAVLCHKCQKQIKPLNFGCCERCGKPFKNCICKKQRLKFTRCVSAFRYENSAVTSLIFKLKSTGNRYVVSFLSEAMFSRLKSEYKNLDFDYITYVPISDSKLRRKGFDHAELLAKALSLKLNIPLVCPPLKRRGGKIQKYLSMRDRSRNAEGAFRLSGDKISGRVLFVDDVMTTGATLSSCSSLLKKAGASEVYCLTAATSAK